MKSRLLLISTILATTAGLGVSSNAFSDQPDAQDQAAALLSGSRIIVSESERITATSEKLGEHPAVAVANKWSTRGIDPNSFIVAHPAGRQIVAASLRTEAETTASTNVVGTVTTGGSGQ